MAKDSNSSSSDEVNSDSNSSDETNSGSASSSSDETKGLENLFTELETIINCIIKTKYSG